MLRAPTFRLKDLFACISLMAVVTDHLSRLRYANCSIILALACIAVLGLMPPMTARIARLETTCAAIGWWLLVASLGILAAFVLEVALGPSDAGYLDVRFSDFPKELRDALETVLGSVALVAVYSLCGAALMAYGRRRRARKTAKERGATRPNQSAGGRE